MQYKIENRIETLAENAIMDNAIPASFSFDNLTFEQWEFDYGMGAIGNHWVVIGTIEDSNHIDALNSFRKKLADIIPKIAFVSQCYCDFVSQSFLVTREKSEMGFLRYVKDIEPVPLSFGDQEYKALTILHNNPLIPKEFYFYWNDAVNSTGYASSLLLMFSAIETLVKEGKSKNWVRLQEILGVDLKEELYGTKINSNIGLRHRITHGEYFSFIDHNKDYLDIVHKKILDYFNRVILTEPLLSLDVVSPQRHLHGNRSGASIYIKTKNASFLNFKDVIKDIEKNGINNLKAYTLVTDSVERQNF